MDSRIHHAVGLLQAGRPQDVVIACRAILADRPSDALALNLLGIGLRQTGELQEAEIALRKAVEHSGGNAEFRTNLAQLLRALGRLDDSIAEFRRALADAPAFLPARLGLARTALQAGQPELAERAARELIEANETSHEAWSALGSALYAQQRHEEAASALRRAVAIEPRYAAARENLATVLSVLDRSEEVLEQYEASKRLGLHGRALDLARARALFQLDRHEESESVLQRLVAEAPDDRDAQFLLAQLRHMRGDADFARELRAAAGRPDAPAATRAQYADALRRTGQHADAESIVRDLIASEGRLPELESALATVLQEAARYDEALVAAQSAHGSRPDDPGIARILVANLLTAGDPAAAQPIVERFHARAPDDQSWITYRADIARLRGEDLFADWCDLDRLVRVHELEPPPGYRSIDEFHEELRSTLEARHRHTMHPLDQSLRGGTQTPRGLLSDPDPLIRLYLAQLAKPLAEYQAAIGHDAAHPMRARNTGPARPTGCWSVRLKRGGFHVNHIHPEGWISSAYYVSVPAEVTDATQKSGWLKFAEPRFPIPGGVPLRFVQPKPGRLVLFPSYLWHGTTPIAGDEPRLTIAFDCLPAM